MPVRKSSLLVGWLAAWLAVVSGCAGYRVGTQSLYYPGIRTVYVPIFESDSYRRNLGERLTEAVVKQIELNTTYKVVNDPMADSVLTGRIVDERKGVVAKRNTGDAREIETRLTVSVNWADRRGQALGSAYYCPVPALLASISASGSTVPEAGLSLATGQQQAIDQLAEQIVSKLEVPW